MAAEPGGRKTEVTVALTGVGMISSVGLGVAQTASSVRAKITRFRELTGFIVSSGPPDQIEEPLVAATVPASRGPDPVAWMARAAMQDLIGASSLTRTQFGEAAIFLCMPGSSRHEKGSRPISEKLSLVLGLGQTGLSGPVTSAGDGHAGSLAALGQAAAAIREGRHSRAIVLAVDTLVDVETLNALDAAGRLKKPLNASGLVPGEAACALLLESGEKASARGAATLAVAGPVGQGQEMQPVGGPQPGTGTGLSEAIMAASTARKDAPFAWVASDMNGEPYRSREWGLSVVRLRPLLGHVKHLWHPADCLGDVGCASGAVLVGLVAQAFQRGYAPAESCLVWASSDDGRRSAVVLSGAGRN